MVYAQLEKHRPVSYSFLELCLHPHLGRQPYKTVFEGGCGELGPTFSYYKAEIARIMVFGGST